jgi:hypothetical protein
LIFFKTGIFMMKRFHGFFAAVLALSAWLSLTALASPGQAQVVPFRLQGTLIGNLNDLSAYGQATGTHFGRCSFFLYSDSGFTYDKYTVADGSTLTLVRVNVVFDIIPVDPLNFPNNPYVYVVGTDYWQIVEGAGTGRFATAKSAGPDIVSRFVTEPFDLFGDVTAIPGVYVKEGLLDLGRRN